MKYGNGLDTTKNPDPYGAQSEPTPDETRKILAESALIHACLKTDWRPPPLLVGPALRAVDVGNVTRAAGNGLAGVP